MQKCTGIVLALAAFVAVASAAYPPVGPTGGQSVYGKVADYNIAAKQKAILQLFAHVHQPTTYAEIAEIAQIWNIPEKASYYSNSAVVQRFCDLHKQGTLPKGEVFHVYNDVHLDEVVALFDLFYFAKDFDTFYKTACWARENYNEGQFVYAVSVAVLHRPDCYGLELPPMYEIYPYFYLSSTDMQTFVDAKMSGYDQYVAKANFSGLYDMTNPEMSLSYFTEDVGLNAYHAYVHLYHPFWMKSERYGLSKKMMRGESFYYFYQQMLARYTLNRMSSYLPEIQDFDWEENLVKPGYYPALKYHSGQYLPARPDEYPLSSIKSYSIADLKAIEYRIKDAIDSGYVITKEGSRIPISSQMHGINMLGNIIEGNKDSVNSRYYGSYYNMLRNLFALIMDPMDKHSVAPGLMAHYETAMRDPAYYVFLKYINEFFVQYKSNLPAYKSADLYFSGVQVKDVQVDKLVTYFDYFDVDVTYGLKTSQQEEASKLNYIARMPRLNHQPFTYKVKVTSGKTTDAVMRVFLGPKAEALHFNFFGDSNVESSGHDTYDLDRLRHYFVELDRFPVKLTNGMNVIQRKSQELTSTVGDHTSFKQLLRQAEQGNWFVKDVDTSCGFPDRLALPMGHMDGMPYTLFVMVTPYSAESYGSEAYTTPYTGDYTLPAKTATSDAGYPGYSAYTSGSVNYPKVQTPGVAHQAPYGCNGLMTAIDNRALGFPFDREIRSFHQFYTPNMYFKDVSVYHQNSTEFKYPYQPYQMYQSRSY